MRKILWGFVTLVTVAVGAFGFSYWKLNSLAKYAIEEAGSKALKTKVTVERVSLMPFSGKGAVYGLKIHNPNGYSSPEALKVARVEVRVNLSALRRKTVEISEVTVFSPEVWYEKRGEQNNFTRLQRNAMRSSHSAHSEKSRNVAQAKQGKTGGELDVILQEFHMTKGTVHLVDYLPIGKTQAVDLPDVHIKHMENMSQSEMIAHLSGVITASAAKVGARMLASPMPINAIKKQILDKGVGKILKSLF